MSRLEICIMTPEAEFLNTEADSIVFSLSDGAYQVLPGHTPLALSLSNGFIRISDSNSERDIWSTEGIAVVKDNTVQIFVDDCAFTEEGLTFDEMQHFMMMQREKQAVKEYEKSKISIARTITGLKTKKNRNM